MNTENTKAQMRKGILEFCILSLISHKEMYVSDLMQELKNGKLDVVEGTLYPLLTRLKNGEFLSYRWEESTGGPPRKYYQITEKEKRFLKKLQNTWNELTNSEPQITNQSKKKTMNKTLSIGLAGFSFIIEEHAYIKLSDYLAALRNSLDAAEADEVMHDIEI